MSIEIERAIRAAARAGNQLLAGSVVSADGVKSGEREPLLEALARMGARSAVASGRPADIVFVDDIGGAGACEGSVAVVAMNGGVRGPREQNVAARIAWAAQGLKATDALLRELRGLSSLSEGRSLRIAVSLVLEPKTAAFALALADAGCDVAVFGAVSETDIEVANALSQSGRVTVFAPHDAVAESDAERLDSEHAAAVLEWVPAYLIDDGAHLIRLAHTERPMALQTLRGAAEETTSGVRPLREMDAVGELRIPVIAVNDARTKIGFDNRIGTGQSCVFAIADLLDRAAWQLPGDTEPRGYRGLGETVWAVLGFGPVGEGVARFAAALGASIIVVEQDPVRSLAALHEGYEARTLAEALSSADVVVSATGVWHTLDAAGFRLLRPGSAVAVAGGIDDELALDELRAEGWRRSDLGEGVAEWIAPGEDRGPLVLAGGCGVNYTGAEGNPVEIMDLSFATQVAALRQLLRGDLPDGLHALPAAAEEAVAHAALLARGGSVDPPPQLSRPGGASQPWRVHRYRSS